MSCIIKCKICRKDFILNRQKGEIAHYSNGVLMCDNCYQTKKTSDESIKLLTHSADELKVMAFHETVQNTEATIKAIQNDRCDNCLQFLCGSCPGLQYYHPLLHDVKTLCKDVISDYLNYIKSLNH